MARGMKKVECQTIRLNSLNCARQFQRINNIIQRIKQYQGDKIIPIFNKGLSFVTQEIYCEFDSPKSSNWISRTTDFNDTMFLNTSSRKPFSIACHLNAVIKCVVINKNNITIQIENSSFHWTIRSLEKQKAIDINEGRIVDSNLAFHRSTGLWNTTNYQSVLDDIGMDPNDFGYFNINIDTTKTDFEKAIKTAYSSDYQTVNVVFI